MGRREKIACVEISTLFHAISREYGFTSDVVLSYFQDIDDLIQRWENHKCVWVYSQGEKHQHGWIKESHIKGNGAVAPLYIGLHHTRLLDDETETDPLLILTFEKRENSAPALIVLAMIDHADMFGETGKKKHNDYQMRLIHQRLDDLLRDTLRSKHT
ncbi:hypothetical protein [Siccibacter turicensis]|uniref:hypothetical protein n=1 Tax=Siccibacter turicensis TaxID=357233 RepID=UPI002A6B722B|nr:hypothetical protein [Siccibacter turicensis]MDY0970856.1 hypothetical protein [Siccibacter turicensis]